MIVWETRCLLLGAANFEKLVKEGKNDDEERKWLHIAQCDWENEFKGKKL